MNVVNPDLLRALGPETIKVSDHDYLEEHSRRVEDSISRSKTDEARAERSQWRINVRLGPIAFDGSAESARVMYLAANPSYGDGATPETHYQPHPAWPLSVLGPHVAPATLDYYRNTVFRHLKDAGVSFEEMSARVLKLELSPWASKKWPSDKLADSLVGFPSTKGVFELVRSLLDQGVLAIVVRAHKFWDRGVPELRRLEGTQAFYSRAPISSAITQGIYPGGWASVVRALKS
jgi:hypothetical protein